MKHNPLSLHVARSSYPLLLAALLLASSFLTLQAAQAAPTRHPLQADVVVTTTIQAAIDAANPGDTVIIPAGVYTESLTLSKAVSLTGVSSATTIIKALPNQRVLTVTGAAIDNTVIISGLTLAGGKAINGFDCSTTCGGGLLINNNAQPFLQNLVLTNNQVSNFGGGIFASSGSPLILSNVTFISNTASIGGGLMAFDVLTLTHANFSHNTAFAAGGGLFARSTLTLTDANFSRNTATSGGGAFTNGPAKLIGGYFEQNISSIGGGLLASDTLTLINSDFISNIATDEGGGLYVNNTLILSNAQFIRNTADVGGGLSHTFNPGRIINALFAGNTVTSTGAALHLRPRGNVEILHSTIVDVSLNPKAAIDVFNSFNPITPSTVSLINTIIASHTVGISRTTDNVYEDYNLFFNVPTTSTGVVAHGGHSLTGDPRFVDPANDDYHLQAGSAALNAALPGLVNTDFEGDPRPFGLGSDIGFDEWIAPSAALTITKTMISAGPLTPGQVLTYTLIVANYGNVPANGVLITDTLPTSVTGASLVTTTIIPAGQSLTFTLLATVAATASPGTIITNTAYYSHTSGSGQASAAFTVQSSAEPPAGIYLPLIRKD